MQNESITVNCLHNYSLHSFRHRAAAESEAEAAAVGADINLFEMDVITKLKKNSDMFRVTRPPYRLNKVVLRDLKEPGNILVTYLNEYGLLANAFVIQLDIGEHSKWRTAIETAKDEYEIKFLTINQ